MTRDKMLEVISKHPEKRFIIRDNYDPDKFRCYCGVLIDKNGIFRCTGWWRLREIIGASLNEWPRDFALSTKSRGASTDNHLTSCSILSDEEIIMALL